VITVKVILCLITC